MSVLLSVQDYLNRTRVLLMDTVNSPYRYPDADLVEALNEGIMEARRLRPDMFIDFTGQSLDVPSYSLSNTAQYVMFDQQYRQALVYYVVGSAQLRDDENTQDSRAAGFMNKFVAQLLSIQS